MASNFQIFDDNSNTEEGIGCFANIIRSVQIKFLNNKTLS